MKPILTIFALALSVSLTFAAEGEKKADGDKPATANADTGTPKANPDKPGEKQGKPDGDKPKVDPAEAFAKRDANGDGKISKEEFTSKIKDPAKAEQAGKRFAKLDKDSDGNLTKEEFVAGAQAGKKKEKN